MLLTSVEDCVPQWRQPLAHGNAPRQAACLSDNRLEREASQEVAESLFSVLDDQVDHTLPDGSADEIGKTKYVDSRLSSYLRHDRTTILALDVSERHLRALVLVDLELRVIEIRDLIQRRCSVLAVAIIWHRQHTSILNNHPRHSNGRVGRHLNGPKATALVAFLA